MSEAGVVDGIDVVVTCTYCGQVATRPKELVDGAEEVLYCGKVCRRRRQRAVQRRRKARDRLYRCAGCGRPAGSVVGERFGVCAICRELLDRHCLRKRRHERAKAVAIAERRPGLIWYGCIACDGWHHTSDLYANRDRVTRAAALALEYQPSGSPLAEFLAAPKILGVCRARIAVNLDLRDPTIWVRVDEAGGHRAEPSTAVPAGD